MTTPEGGEGWETVQARNNDTARGHGVHVAPDPSPEGVRAETRRTDDGARGTPGSAPLAARNIECDLCDKVIFVWPWRLDRAWFTVASNAIRDHLVSAHAVVFDPARPS